MRKLVIAFFVFALLFGGIPMTAYAAVDCTKDTPFDKVWDWATAIGKKDMEKNQVLAKNKADRVAACMKREADKAAKEAQKAGEAMKQKLGF